MYFLGFYFTLSLLRLIAASPASSESPWTKSQHKLLGKVSIMIQLLGMMYFLWPKATASLIAFNPNRVLFGPSGNAGFIRHIYSSTRKMCQQETYFGFLKHSSYFLHNKNIILLGDRYLSISLSSFWLLISRVCEDIYSFNMLTGALPIWILLKIL